MTNSHSRGRPRGWLEVAARVIFLGAVAGCGKPAAPSEASGIPLANLSDAQPVVPLPPTTQPGRVVAGDLLEIHITDLDGPGVPVDYLTTVASDGTTLPPYLTKPVRIAGLDDLAAARAVQAAYDLDQDFNVGRVLVLVHRLRVAGTGGPAPGKIAPFDLLRIELPESGVAGSHTVVVARVTASGDFAVPCFPPFHLAGLTDRAAQQAIGKAMHDQENRSGAEVGVLRLEAAPSDAGRVDLPDAPIYPVPEYLQWLYRSSPAGTTPAASHSK